MSGDAASQPPWLRGHAVYLVPDAADAAALVALARRDGRLVVERDLAGARDDADVLAAFTADWAFPIAAVGYDALIGLLANLEWLDNDAGYLLRLDGLGALAHTAPRTFELLVSVLPGICDRWRTVGTPFCAVVHDTAAVLDRAAALLAHENEQQEAAGALPWVNDTKATEIIRTPLA